MNRILNSIEVQSRHEKDDYCQTLFIAFNEGVQKTLDIYRKHIKPSLTQKRYQQVTTKIVRDISKELEKQYNEYVG